MPELPEVQTVLNTLELRIKDLEIIDVIILYPNIVDMDPIAFKNSLINQHFRNFKRRGKFLLFEMDDVLLVSHLRMEGKYFIKQHDEPVFKHTHIIFRLSNGQDLRYNDVRKFGRMYTTSLKPDYKVFHKLGVEPFSEDFNLEYCQARLSKSHRVIKQELLDQSFIAGIGNIYADEILFYAKLNPAKKANTLTTKEIQLLIKGTQEILKMAIADGGTTIRSYTSSLGVTGRFQQHLQVHQREGEKCYLCQSTIIKTKVAQRGTYYCPKCQKLV